MLLKSKLDWIIFECFLFCLQDRHCLLAFYPIFIFGCFAPKGAVLSAEGSYAWGARGKAPRLVQGVQMAGRWRISYSSIVLKNPGAALRRYGGLLDVFKSFIKEPLLPPPTSVVVQWTWTRWLEDDYSSYVSFDSEQQQHCGDVALPLESREEEQPQYDYKESKGHFDLADSIVKKLNRDGKGIDDVDAIEAIELAVQWGAMTEGTLDESLNFTSLNPLTDRGCRWFTSARWHSWAGGPGSFSRGASALLKVVYSVHNLEMVNGGQQPEMADTYDANVAADSTHARLEALPEDWLDEMMKEVLDRESYPPDPRPYPLGPVSPHTPFGRSLWMWKNQNGSPVGRLFSRFSNHLAGLVDVGGVGVVSASWERFMWEIRYLWEERESIPGMLPLPIVDGVDMLDPHINGQAMGVQQCLRQLWTEKPVAKPDMDPVLYPPEPDPDLRLGSITQLLMLVNCCIGAVAVTVEGSNNDTKKGIAVDDDPFYDEYIENAEINSAEEEDEKYFYDVSRDGDRVVLIPPKLSPLCTLVDHAGYGQAAVALHVMKFVLIADMEAFLRSNPEATCDDFCIWYGLWSRNDDDEEWSSSDVTGGLGWSVEKKNVTFIPKEQRTSAECHHGAPLQHETEGEKMSHSSHLAQKTVSGVGRDEFSTPPPAASPDKHHGLTEQHEKVVSQVPAFKCIGVNLHQSCSHEKVDCRGGGLEVVEGASSTSFIPIAACWAEANKKRNNNSSIDNRSHCSIFSPSTEAEKALHLLEIISSSKLCIEALSAFVTSADFVLCMAAHRLGLIESFSCVKESLCDLRQWMERKIDDGGGDSSSNSNECSKSIAESLAYGCELLTIAEGCVQRAIAIRNSFPRIPPDVANNLARYPCTRHVGLPSGPEGSSAVSKLGKVICGVNWERGGIPPPPSRREYILSCPASGLRPMGGRGCGVVGNGGNMTQARMHAIVLEPSQALRNVTTTCQVRISTAIPEPEAMTIIL